MSNHATATKTQGFVEYYSSNDISPVSQDLRGVEYHFKKRRMLYQSLGITERFVNLASVLEFGPGSGHNSIYTASLWPRRYELVEGNPVGLAHTRDQLRSYLNGETVYSFVHSMIENHKTDSPSDLVLAEGLLPFQIDPVSVFKRIASCVCRGGIMVATTASAATCLPETLRRIFATLETEGIDSLEAKVDRLKGELGSHLATLPGANRPIEDWLLDNVLQPFYGRKLFSFEEALIEAGSALEFLGSSPIFVTDYRWYKDRPDGISINDNAVRAYRESLARFIDVRYLHSKITIGADLYSEIESLCQALYVLANQLQTHPNERARILAECDASLEALRKIFIALTMTETAQSISEFLSYLRSGTAQFDKFKMLWGMGQQYLSFTRIA
jgi:hypothetical protein